MIDQRSATHSNQTTNLGEVIERVLDKGIVIAGDIKVNLVDIELLTVQIRLVICSVDKAKEMGMDWWEGNPDFTPRARKMLAQDPLTRIEERVAKLEEQLKAAA